MKHRYINYLKTCTLAFIVLVLITMIMFYPKDSVRAAARGLSTWANFVLPALLPFFIGSELLGSLGIIRFIGVLLEPIMRPVFNVPGEGGFALAMGVTSGYPVGSKITVKLRQEKQCSKIEGQRLLSFCNNSGPLFILGTIAIGMYNNHTLGILMLLSHYFSSIIIGLLFKYYKKKETRHVLISKTCFSLKYALQQLVSTREKDGRTFGEMMRDSVSDSINSILIIGGFIILFSVILELLVVSGIINFLSIPIVLILRIIGYNDSLGLATAKGFFEITLGNLSLSQIPGIPLIQKATMSSFLIAWSGLCIHAQTISIVSKSDINITIYLLCKLFHGILASIVTYFSIITIMPSLCYQTTFNNVPIYKEGTIVLFKHSISVSIRYFLIIVFSLICFTVLLAIIRRIRIIVLPFRQKGKKI